MQIDRKSIVKEEVKVESMLTLRGHVKFGFIESEKVCKDWGDVVAETRLERV